MYTQETGISRRSFLKASGVGIAALTGLGLAGCAEKEAGSKIADLPESWDVETDIVIVGHGGAGAAAAIACENEQLGEYYVMDAAPEGQDGGNTKVSMNLMFIPESVEGAVAYQTALNDMYVVEDELIRGWAESLNENKEWLEGLGIDIQESTAFSPEFPEIEGSESSRTYLVDGIAGNNSLWAKLVDQEEYLGIPINYDTRATKIYRDPSTNEALGVQAEQGGKTLAIKARKAVILACGGFENNPDMCRDYLGIGQTRSPLGTPFNRGDGFELVSPFGAKLWHMNNVSGTQISIAGMGLDEPFATWTMLGTPYLTEYDYLFVGRDGKRFMCEELAGTNRHGKIMQGGAYMDLSVPENSWVVFGKNFFENGFISLPEEEMLKEGWVANVDGPVAQDNQGFLDAGVIVHGATPEELASVTGLPADELRETIEEYNSFVDAGSDPEFHRGEPILEATFGGEEAEIVPAFELKHLEPPFYATPIRGGIYNTQGGPKRNASGQVLDAADEPIGRLYGAGEFGALYPYMYNGGGNVSEAIATGRVAARHAATLDPWDSGKA